MGDQVIVLTGIEETLSALGDFDKDAVKRFKKVINDELKSAQGEARGFVKQDPPFSGWRKTDAIRPTKTRGGKGWPGWDAAAIQKGIVKTTAQGKVRGDFTTSAGALKNTSAAGAIFEVAGRRNQGSIFVKSLEKQGFGKASRVIWRIVDKDSDKIQKNVARALEEAKALLQRHLNRGQA
jgi:hypothetical protein